MEYSPKRWQPMAYKKRIGSVGMQEYGTLWTVKKRNLIRILRCWPHVHEHMDYRHHQYDAAYPRGLWFAVDMVRTAREASTAAVSRVAVPLCQSRALLCVDHHLLEFCDAERGTWRSPEHPEAPPPPPMRTRGTIKLPGDQRHPDLRQRALGLTAPGFVSIHVRSTSLPRPT